MQRWLVVLALLGCRKDAVVACPEGRTWSEADRACIAYAAPAPRPAPSPEPAPVPSSDPATVVVRCDTATEAFAALIPTKLLNYAEVLFEESHESLDGGLTHWGISAPPVPPDPKFDPIRPYAAKSCKPEATFVVPPGDWTLYARVPAFHAYAQHPKLKKALLLRGHDSIQLKFTKADFEAEASSCCHCPFVSIVGSSAPAFEVLGGRSSEKLSGIDRKAIELPVQGHRASIRIRELEEEVSYISSVALEVDGKRLTANEPAKVVLRRGDEQIFSFAVPVADGTVPATLVVEGYYVLATP